MRAPAAIAIASGIAVAGLGFALPARAVHVARIRQRLDECLPVYEVSERHTLRVAASKDRVYRAIKEVTAEEITFFRTLTGIRRLGCRGQGDILDPPRNEALLDVATRTGFVVLADDPGREIVIGTAVIAPDGWRPSGRPAPESFANLRRPRFALAAMNFRIEEDGPGACRLSTETRVHATDAASRRRFSAYGRVISPGSACLRRMRLRAMRRLTESSR